MTSRQAPIVIALGGNAISPPGEVGDITQQFRHTRRTVAALRPLLASAAPLIFTHGNGPQVGAALRRVELSAHEVYPVPLGILVADLQGGMGYMIAQCLTNELHRLDRPQICTAVVTTVEISADDPALDKPSKPVGTYFPQDRAQQLIRDLGWQMVATPHGWRRVVPSPTPLSIMEIDLIRRLLEDGDVIVAVGGGGIPVARDESGNLNGYEAVVDKDFASGILAREVGAETLVIVTSVQHVYLDFGKPTQRSVDRMNVKEAKEHLAAGQFPAGSMGPKIRAAVNFVESADREGAEVLICDIDHFEEAVAGRSGTRVVRA